MTTDRTINNAKRMLPRLVEYAKSGQKVTYKRLAEDIGCHHRAIPPALGYLRDDICRPRQLPHINVIVVNSQSGRPGASVFADSTTDLSNSAEVQLLHEAQEEAFNYRNWDALLNELGLTSATEPEEVRTVKEMLEELTGKVDVAGQGWSTDPATRKAIEDHAMHVAEEHYVRQGWSCTNCSASESYDLHLSKGGHSDLRVEVNGTRSDGSIVLLTRNEVCHAREHYPNVTLFMVHGVHVQIGLNGRPVVSGGQNSIYEKWDVAQGTLEPLAFEYTVPSGG